MDNVNQLERNWRALKNSISFNQLKAVSPSMSSANSFEGRERINSNQLIRQLQNVPKLHELGIEELSSDDVDTENTPEKNQLIESREKYQSCKAGGGKPALSSARNLNFGSNKISFKQSVLEPSENQPKNSITPKANFNNQLLKLKKEAGPVSEINPLVKMTPRAKPETPLNISTAHNLANGSRIIESKKVPEKSSFLHRNTGSFVSDSKLLRGSIGSQPNLLAPSKQLKATHLKIQTTAAEKELKHPGSPKMVATLANLESKKTSDTQRFNCSLQVFKTEQSRRDSSIAKSLKANEVEQAEEKLKNNFEAFMNSIEEWESATGLSSKAHRNAFKSQFEALLECRK